MTPSIQWIDEQQASGDLSQIYEEWFAENLDRQKIPDILKCFSQRPDFLRDVVTFSNRIHFSDGHLDRRTKERIATYVSGLNKCPY